MSNSSQDAWLVTEGNRLRVIPDSGEAWANGRDAAVFRFNDLEFGSPNMRLSGLRSQRTADRRTAVGIYFDMVMFPELIHWLSRGFENVRRVREDAFYVLLSETPDFVEDVWPFLPCEAFR